MDYQTIRQQTYMTYNIQNEKLDYSQVQKLLLHEIRFFQIPKVALVKEGSNVLKRKPINQSTCNCMDYKTGENSHCHFWGVCKQDELLNYIC